MKESENVSLFIASFYEKKFLKLYFSYFREEINSTQGFMKKLSITILFFLLAFCQINAQQAKYVFYFIGDGMGVNQVQGTELYLAYIIHSGFISGYQNRYGDNLKPPTNVYHRMTA